jgi:hypothetical protein
MMELDESDDEDDDSDIDTEGATVATNNKGYEADQELAQLGEEVRTNPLFRWGGKCYFLTYSQVSFFSLTVFIILSNLI